MRKEKILWSRTIPGDVPEWRRVAGRSLTSLKETTGSNPLTWVIAITCYMEHGARLTLPAEDQSGQVEVKKTEQHTAGRY